MHEINIALYASRRDFNNTESQMNDIKIQNNNVVTQEERKYFAMLGLQHSMSQINRFLSKSEICLQTQWKLVSRQIMIWTTNSTLVWKSMRMQKPMS